MMTVLETRLIEKPWGVDMLPSPFTVPPGQRIGEVWFDSAPGLEALLVKYLFTSDKLSVQVHPSDAQTEAAGSGRQGKEECWLIISAEPGARIGIGFTGEISQEVMRAAALDGSIESLLDWKPVQPGDFFYIPANTVHAIGAGIGLIEIQQNSDITYRLYDYGRPRQLHLDEAVAVARRTPYHDPRARRVPDAGELMLVDGPFFRLLRFDGPLSASALAAFGDGPALAVVQSGAMGGGAAGDCIAVGIVADLKIDEGAMGLIAQPV
jgi:mannose-6-phosphate isomerase